MQFTKTHFDDFIKNNGHPVLVAHTQMKTHCDCYDYLSHEGDPDCPKCFGTGWSYSWSLTKTRRVEKSFKTSELSMDLPFKISGPHYRYFFKSEVKINKWDFIMEFTGDNARNKYNLYFVSNDLSLRGQNGNESYQTVLANSVVANEKQIKNSLSHLDIPSLNEV